MMVSPKNNAADAPGVSPADLSAPFGGLAARDSLFLASGGGSTGPPKDKNVTQFLEYQLQQQEYYRK